VLFIYISRLASNENFLINFKSTALPIILTITIVSVLLIIDNNRIDIELNNNLDNFILKTYSNQLFPIIIITIVYLLFTLIVVAEIIKLYQAPLRSSSYDNYP